MKTHQSCGSGESHSGRCPKPRNFCGTARNGEARLSENNSQELQLAAVEAVIRSKGRFGLGLAMGYQQATHWWEEEHVAKQLSRMLIAENAPVQRE